MKQVNISLPIRDGREAIVLAIDTGGLYTVHGLIKKEGLDEWTSLSWTTSGRFLLDDTHHLDLMNFEGVTA